MYNLEPGDQGLLLLEKITLCIFTEKRRLVEIEVVMTFLQVKPAMVKAPLGFKVLHSCINDTFDDSFEELDD